MAGVSKYTIDIVNPAVELGRPPRDIKPRDIITVPIDYTRGSNRILDLIDNESALAVMAFYNRKNASK